MKVLVVNCGSSSLKYQLIDMSNEDILAKGLVDRIGIEGSILTHSPAGKGKVVFNQEIKDHSVAMEMVLKALLDADHGVIGSIDEIDAVGHRTVQGGSKFNRSVLIDQEVVDSIKRLYVLAPLHNPPGVIGIEACQKVMPGKPMVAVFDTAFHQTMPEKAYNYGISKEMKEKYELRKYGYHGTSHRYVSAKVAEIMGKPAEDLKIITCHLGNGSSIAAVQGGKCVDTSMGLTPVDGLLMGTRCGNIDPGLILFLMEQENMDVKAMNSYINKQCGFLGISGTSSDLRNIEAAADAGDKDAQLSIDVFYYGIIKHIGSYVAAMNGVDVIVFTAGIGENSAPVRKAILDQLGYLGVEIDEEANNVRGEERLITSANSKVAAYIVPTNEEMVIARDTAEIVSNL